MGVYAHGKQYYARFQIKGKSYREPFGSYSEAEKWEEDAKRAIRRGQPVPQPSGSQARSIASLGALCDHVHKTRWSTQRSGNQSVSDARHFVDWFGADREAREVTAMDLANYIGLLVDKGRSPRTVNRRLTRVSTMFNVGVRLQVLSQAPSWDKLKQNKKTMIYLDFGEEQTICKFLAHIGQPRLEHLVPFLCDTGLRWGEATKLTWDNVLEDRIHIQPEVSKIGEFRVVPLTARARAAVEMQRTQHELGPWMGIGYQSARDKLKHIYDTLGGKYARIEQPFHVYRHSCASRLAIKGVDAKRVQEWMGHKTIITTMIYMKLAPKDLFEAASALE